VTEVWGYADHELEDATEEFLTNEMDRLEDYLFDDPEEDDTNLHVVRLLWALKNKLRFPLYGVRASRR
jgi:hypothetical protein